MSCKNPTGRGAALDLTIGAEQARMLRPILEMVRDGVKDELAMGPGRIREPARLRHEADAYARLLAALEGGWVVPDPDLIRVLAELAESIDTANEYRRVVAEHDALHGLLAQLVPGEPS
jgi:hypothetical protein